jgi:hypothetical protein
VRRSWKEKLGGRRDVVGASGAASLLRHHYFVEEVAQLA